MTSRPDSRDAAARLQVERLQRLIRQLRRLQALSIFTREKNRLYRQELDVSVKVSRALRRKRKSLVDLP